MRADPAAPPTSESPGLTAERSPSRRPSPSARPGRDTVPVREDSVAPRPPGSRTRRSHRAAAGPGGLPLVFQHLPVERCRLPLSDVAGAEVSAGFIHSCLARAASMAAGVVKLIKTLIIASRVVGFDETTLRSGAAGQKKYVHGAFTEKYSLFHLGTRSLDTMKDFGILAGFAASRSPTGTATTSTRRGRTSPATRPASPTYSVTCKTARKPTRARSGPARRQTPSAR